MARILVTDDEEGIRTFLAEALQSEGHEVETAASGVEASDRLGRARFDLLITDLKMPGMGGMDLLERARTAQPDMEVIVLTAYGSVTSAVEAMRRGAFDFVEKPLPNPAALRLLVARALERRALAVRRNGEPARPAPRLSFADPAMATVVEALQKVAPTDATVLLLGESGTGKEVVARTLHAMSSAAQGPFVAVNCAALSEHLLESELFGHEKGAFTGAHSRRRGRLELAQGGTLFLDEIAELKPSLQAKLLRVLEERRFERVGGSQTLSTDARWVAATNRDLGPMLADGRFREDLYHRLAVFPIRLPPLRERTQDIAPLAQALLVEVGRALGRPALHLDPSAERALREHHWPGNVRELRNTLERAAIMTDGDRVASEHLWLDPTTARQVSAAAAPSGSLEDLERAAIERALAECGGNRRRAAERLGIGLRTLYDKLKRYGIR
jgi:two-component system, NtrC family, response regulator AtoC